MSVPLSEKKHVLLAEDEEFMADIYTMKLTREGFAVTRVENGQEVLDTARLSKPDIILLDLIMPVKDGFVTLKELKADPLLKDITVLVFSSLNQEKDVKEVLALGAADYCIKDDIYFPDLLQKMRLHLGINQTEQE